MIASIKGNLHQTIIPNKNRLILMSHEPTLQQEKWNRKKEGWNTGANSNAALKLSCAIQGPSRTVWTGGGCRDRVDSWNLHWRAVSKNFTINRNQLEKNRTINHGLVEKKIWNYSYVSTLLFWTGVTWNKKLLINLLKPSGFLNTTRLNIQKFYIQLALRWVFCTYQRTDSGFCFIRH